MKIYIGADHAGFDLKQTLVTYLTELGHDVDDKGAYEFNQEDDYPDFIFPVAQAVAKDPDARGIVIGSSGQGEGIAVNRVPGARALVYYGNVQPLSETKKTGEQKEMVKVSREDNNSNVLSLGASFVTADEAKRVAKLWLDTPFTGEERHQRRIDKVENYQP